MSIKLSLEKANELLSKIGIDAAVVADDSADANPDVENMSKAVFSEMETKIKHDVELEVKDIARKEQDGKVLGTLRRAIKRNWGIDEKETAELGIDEMIKLGKDKLSAPAAEANNDLAKRLTELQAEMDQKEEALRQDYEKRLLDKDEMFNYRDQEERFMSVVNGIPRVGGDAILQAKTLLSQAKSQYSLKYNPQTKEVEFWSKDNPEAKAFDGKNVITDKYFAEKYLKEMGVYAQDARGVVPKDVITGKETKVVPGIGVQPALENDPVKFLEASFGQQA